MSEPDAALNRFARQACSRCRSQKRKCSRELPACQLCRKQQRPCQYPPESPSMHSNAPEDSYRGELLSLFFLDSYTFNRRRHILPPSTSAIPAEFRELVGDPLRMQADHEIYFSTVHGFFPMVSKVRLRQLLSTTTEPQADVVLLFVCMKLVCLPPDGDVIHAGDLYDKAKRCLAYVEASGVLSVRMLQASVLVALYEVAHAIYPAAYLSVGYCARIGYALGIHDRKSAQQILFPGIGSWTGVEELRRIWWAIFVLDRYVNVGIDCRPFARGDAKGEDMLPMDEALWDSGEQSVTHSLAVSSSIIGVSAPPFARTCQASHLLSLVLSHVNGQNTDMQHFYEEGIQLHRVITSFRSALLAEAAVERADAGQPAPLSTATGICYSALIALYDRHSCADTDDVAGVGLPVQLEMQQIALDGLKELLQAVRQFASALVSLAELHGHGAMASSPFAADCLYAAANLCAWYIRETGNTSLGDHVQTLTGALTVLGRRWGAANKYLAILRGEERSIPF